MRVRDLIRRLSGSEALTTEGTRQLVVTGLVRASPLATWKAVDAISSSTSFLPMVDGLARIDAPLLGLDIRVQVTDRVPGETWAASIDGAGLPFATRIDERWTFEAEGDATRVTLAIAYAPGKSLRRVAPLLEPAFKLWFKGLITALDRLAKKKELQGTPANSLSDSR